MSMHVETYSGFTYAQEPRAFVLDGITHHVTQIVRHWRTPEKIHFYVRDERDEFFELTYTETEDTWAIRAFGKTCPPLSKRNSS